MGWLIFVAGAVLSWGAYGVLLAQGQSQLGNPLKALLCVGAAALLGWALEPVRVAAPVIATFVLAILYAVVFLLVYGALRTPMSSTA